MTDFPYEWKGDYFCDDDIVAAITDYTPWSLWTFAGNTPGEDSAEDELDDIAAMFNIDRDDPVAVARREFPVLLHVLPNEPVFCSACFRWFR
jgi:hypothetical protein